MAIPLWSTVVRASPAVGVPSQHDSDLYTVGESSLGASLTGGWNLISLPITPFDTSIESVLTPLAFPYDLVSIWYYDRCNDEWLVYGNGDTTFKTLTTMEDGKAYWVRMRYPEEQHSDPAISGTYPYNSMGIWHQSPNASKLAIILRRVPGLEHGWLQIHGGHGTRRLPRGLQSVGVRRHIRLGPVSPGLDHKSGQAVARIRLLDTILSTRNNQFVILKVL